LVGFIAGYENQKASFIAFNTCYKQVTIIEDVQPGTCFEKHDAKDNSNGCIKSNIYSPDKQIAIEKIREIMDAEHQANPNEIGGPTDILEISPNGESIWFPEKPHILNEETIISAPYTDEGFLYIIRTDKNNKYNLTRYS
jgi:hypothetical protein